MIELHILTGPEQGQSFQIEGDTISIGRSRENDIQIKDHTVSRIHLQISRKQDQYFVRDLDSQNGTFFNGEYIKPDKNVNVKEGVPIVIGMSVICLGKGCLEYIGPYLDSIELTREIVDGKEEVVQNRKTSNQKILELIYKVSNILTESLDVGEISEKILDKLFEFLKRIDRGVLVLIDPETGESKKTITRLNKTQGKVIPEGYCREVVDQVIQNKKAVMIADPDIPQAKPLAESLKSQDIGSVMCVPLRGSTQILGVIYVDALNETHGCRQKDLPVLADLSRRAALAIEHALLYEDLDKAENE
jgi:pSer/pThr/pTyr-binding forkhead associated (FHA) protein